eukprot:gene5645-9461_t
MDQVLEQSKKHLNQTQFQISLELKKEDLNYDSDDLGDIKDFSESIDPEKFSESLKSSNRTFKNKKLSLNDKTNSDVRYYAIFRCGKQVLFLENKNTPQFHDFKMKLKEYYSDKNLEDDMKENKWKVEIPLKPKFSKEERELLKNIDDVKNFEELDDIEKAKIFSIQGFDNLIKKSTGLTEENAFQVIKDMLSSYKKDMSEIFKGIDHPCYFSYPGGEPEHIDENILKVLERNVNKK